MKLPKKKKINGNVWRILQVESPRNEVGSSCKSACFAESKNIYIKIDLGKDQKLKCYTKEIINAICFELGIEHNNKFSEVFADNLSGLFKLIPK